MKNVTKIRTLYRWFRVLQTIASFLVEASLIRHDETLKRKALLCQKYAKRLLKVLNIKIETRLPKKAFQSGLLVSNHVSYLDILVMSAEIPTLFVTSVEVRNSGLGGWVSKLAGCLFVERRSRDQRDEEIRQIEIVLSMGIPVVVFPEATSSNGQKVLPFKSTLYECAIRAKVPVHNFLIRYQDEEVPYYGDMTLLSHLFKLSSVDQITAHFYFLETFQISEQTERKALAQASEALIRESYVAGI